MARRMTAAEAYAERVADGDLLRVIREAVRLELEAVLAAQPADPPKQLAYTVPQAAEVLGLSEHSVRQAIKRGALPAVPAILSGSRTLVPVMPLELLINEGRTFRPPPASATS